MKTKTLNNNAQSLLPLPLQNQPITTNHLSSRCSFPQNQNTQQNSDQSHLMPIGLPQQQTNTPNTKLQQCLQYDMRPAIEQHRRFLQNYKRQRGDQIRMIRDKYFSSHSVADQSYVQEQSQNCDSELQLQQQTQEKSLYAEAISQKLHQIHRKIEKDIIRQPANTEMRKFKLFDGVVSSKNDLQRVAKQRRFVRSQQEKYDYQQPQMPHKNLMPLKYRVNTQSYDEQVGLAKKAKQFIEKVHKEQQNLLGKQILRKKKQQSKRMKQQKQQQKKRQQLHEIKKQERRLKAEQNLLVMREKLKINKIVNRNSIEQLRKILTQKQYRLQAMQHSIRQKQGKPHKSYSICSKIQHKAKRQSASDQSEDQPTEIRPKNRQLNISIDKLKKLQQKETYIRSKLKLGTNKHKAIRPTEYNEDYQERQQQHESKLKTDYGQKSEVKHTISKEQREFLNTQMSLSLNNSSTSAINKQDQHKSEYLTQNGNSASITEPQSAAERQVRDKSSMQFEQNTFGMGKQSSRLSKKGQAVSSMT